MAFCTKCGHQLAAYEQICSRCGQAVVARKVKTMTPTQEYKPYSWANSDPNAGPLMQPQPQPLMQPQYVSPLARSGYKCPRCGSHNPPIIDSRISVAGWVVFAIMIVTGICLPLCWIGLLMKEDYTICPMCRCQLNWQK
jgi:hypothetical protein